MYVYDNWQQKWQIIHVNIVFLANQLFEEIKVCLSWNGIALFDSLKNKKTNKLPLYELEKNSRSQDYSSFELKK